MIIIAKMPHITLKTPWVYHLTTSACTLCEKEIPPSFCGTYQLEQVGILFKGNPQNANILLITGPINEDTLPQVLNIYKQMPRPNAVVALGSCLANGRVYSSAPSLAGPPGSLLPIDVYVPGCPPHPKAVALGIQAAGRFLMEGRQCCIKGRFSAVKG
jgi:ech hydrogenase subunit C